MAAVTGATVSYSSREIRAERSLNHRGREGSTS